MKQFVENNAVTIILVLVGLVASWTMFQSRLDVVEAQAMENKQNIATFTQLVERVIRLEEGRLQVSEDIQEIKADIKDLKTHFNLQ